MKRIYLILFLVFVTAFAGCGTSSLQRRESVAVQSDSITTKRSQEPTEESAADADVDDGADKPKNMISPEKEKKVSLDTSGSAKKENAEPTKRKIIRNATLQLEAGNPEDVQQKITAIAEKKEGFVVQSRRTGDKTRNRNSVTLSIRVPADKFEEVITEIRKTANRVVDESVNGKDVTEEFIDIEARLKTKRALEERFLEIMKQSRSVKDALNVQRELAKVRGEIERIEGRKRFLENQASLSTIKVSVRTPTAISGSSSGFFYELKDAISDGFDAALGFILILIRLLIAIIPFLLLIVLPTWLVLRYLWRRTKRKRATRKIVEEEIVEENG